MGQGGVSSQHKQMYDKLLEETVRQHPPGYTTTHIRWSRYHGQDTDKIISDRVYLVIVETDLSDDLMLASFERVDGFPNRVWVADGRPIANVRWYAQVGADVEFPT